LAVELSLVDQVCKKTQDKRDKMLNRYTPATYLKHSEAFQHYRRDKGYQAKFSAKRKVLEPELEPKSGSKEEFAR
jgi:hypothetical protein